LLTQRDPFQEQRDRRWGFAARVPGGSMELD
jgi:hypothetical protein